MSGNKSSLASDLLETENLQLGLGSSSDGNVRNKSSVDAIRSQIAEPGQFPYEESQLTWDDGEREAFEIISSAT